MATLFDVAKLSGVSISTVSHVVNLTRKVSPDTAARVRAAIEQTGYRPNPIARALRRSTTESIGFIVSDIGNSYFTDVIRGVAASALAAQQTLLLAISDDDPVIELEAIRALAERRVDGLVVSLTPESGAAVIPHLASLDMPVVLIDRAADANLDQVLVENVLSTAALVRHLLDLGHRRVGMIAGAPGISTTVERIEGWRMAHAEAGLQVDEGLLVNGQSRSGPAQVATLGLLRLVEPPTAIVAGNNSMTRGALLALRSEGKQVPTDVAVVGFDDFEWAAEMEPSLTVIAQPTYEVGQKAVELLLRRLAKPTRRRQVVRLDPTFIHRQSCGCRLKSLS